MRLLILTASLLALALAKPEMYKESEDFQYSRSSSDEGSKSGFYGAQRGNMGGNFEKAHNMDSMAQNHLSTLVRQVDGELGEGANTKTGSVFTAGNSRGIYGSGNYDLSNLRGRNFGESSDYDSQSQLYQNNRHRGNSYYTNNAGYGSEQSLSSKQNSGYSSSNHEAQYSSSNSESENKYHGASNYDSGALGGSNARYYTLDNSQRGAYDQSNTNLHSTYDLSNQNRITSGTPVKIYIRPGERVTLPISAPSYTLYSSNLQDKKSDSTNVLSNSGSELSYQPTNNAKHYQSAYSYHKKWEKHDTQPLVVVPTENPFPANSELYENRQLDQTGQRYQSELDSANTHLSNSAHQNYQSGISSANAQSSKTNSAYSRGYSANTKTASASQARYQSEAQNNAASSSSTHSLDTDNLGSSASNLNTLVEDINSRPKNYHSSFSYHKAWERRGDPYVIIPSGDIDGQTSQKLTAASQNQGQFSSQQYGSQYNRKSYSNVDCDALCYQRRKRSYNMNQYEKYLNNGDIHLGQQSENAWDSDKFENLEDLGQQTQNTWDNLEDNLGQQTQNTWGANLFEEGQQTQNEWSNLGQQTENQSSQLENLDQEAQNHFSNNKDLGQQNKEKASELEDLGQTQSQLGDLGQETQSEWDALGQQTQNQWGKMEDLGQHTQTNWENQKEFGQTHTGDLEDKPQTQTADYNKFITHQQEKKIPKVNSDEPANPKFWWDTINPIYEEPPKTEKVLKTGESLHDIEQLFGIEKLPTDKQSEDGQLPQSNKNGPTISTTTTNNKNQESSSTESFRHSEPKDVPDKQKHENSPTIPSEPREWGNSGQESENQWSNLGQQSETQWSNLGQESENQWSNLGQESESQGSNLGQQSETQWNDLGQQSENQWSNLGQQSETQWSNLGQQSENQWSNLGQQSENQWSNLGQQSENQWSNLGQQSENQWSNLGQQSENQWSNLGQQSETQWSNLGHQSDTQWSNLGQQSENLFSNLGQESENQWINLGQKNENPWNNLGQKNENPWNNLGQKNENPWINLGQQGENQWSNLGQQTHNIWYNHGDQQSQFTGGQQQGVDQDKTTGFAGDKAKTETEITHNVEDQSLNEFINTYFQQVDNWSHHSHINKQNQPATKDTENLQKDNKDLISGDSVLGGTHNVETQYHENDITSSKSPIVDLDTTNPKTTTELPKPSVLNKDTANIGRGDIDADDKSYEFGGHFLEEQEKPNFIIYNLPSTTRKPINNEHNNPYTNILLDSTVSKIPVIEESTPEKSKTVTLPSQNFEEQDEDQQQQFEQQSLDLQQTQEGLSVLPVNQDYKTVETEPLEKVTQKHELPVGRRYWFAEQETKHELENLESTTKKQIEIETPLEATTEKTGFWSSVWNKTKNAKNSVVHWFKN